MDERVKKGFDALLEGMVALKKEMKQTTKELKKLKKLILAEFN